MSNFTEKQLELTREWGGYIEKRSDRVRSLLNKNGNSESQKAILINILEMTNTASDLATNITKVSENELDLILESLGLQLLHIDKQTEIVVSAQPVTEQ